MIYHKDTGAITQGRDDKPAKINLFETPRCFIDVHILRPGQEAKVHAHAGEDKCYHVLSGRGLVHVGDEVYDVGPGEIVFCPATVPHGARNEGADDLRLLVVMAPHPRPEAVPPRPGP